VDLSRFIAGPYCAMLLGDMGADVVKVEPPGRGENSRAFGPFFEGESLYTMVFNRNKRSLTLDLRSSAGQRSPCASCCEQPMCWSRITFPVPWRKMGFAWDVMKELNPRLIVTRISGFGQSGPLSGKPCFDVIAQTMSGLMDITGDPAGHPTMSGTYIVDYSTGLYAVIGTLGALQARSRTGAGQIVDVALLDSALSMLMTAIPEQMLLGRTMTRRGNRDRYGAPANTFPTRDGAWVHMAVAGEPMFRALLRIMGHEKLAGRSALRGQQREDAERGGTGRVDHRLDRNPDFGRVAGRASGDRCPVSESRLGFRCHRQCPSGHRGQILNMEHPKAGTVPMQGFSVQFGESPMRLRYPPPLLGEHTDAILAQWLAMTPERIIELRKCGAI
jgi:crotonobetainyl-CoA:carnitine CoA-transferase CaiB-like acyl-CoA transferase